MYIICVDFHSINGQKISNSLKNKVIEWRHQLHQNPELSNKEYKTTTFIEKNVEFVDDSSQEYEVNAPTAMAKDYLNKNKLI